MPELFCSSSFSDCQMHYCGWHIVGHWIGAPIIISATTTALKTFTNSDWIHTNNRLDTSHCASLFNHLAMTLALKLLQVFNFMFKHLDFFFVRFHRFERFSIGSFLIFGRKCELLEKNFTSPATRSKLDLQVMMLLFFFFIDSAKRCPRVLIRSTISLTLSSATGSCIVSKPRFFPPRLSTRAALPATNAFLIAIQVDVPRPNKVFAFTSRKHAKSSSPHHE
jgi:hypothetical protein